MILYPEVQQRLHDEVTCVTGPDRLPDYHEIEGIPYLHAVVRELLRWQPVVPLCIPSIWGLTYCEVDLYGIKQVFRIATELTTNTVVITSRRVP